MCSLVADEEALLLESPVGAELLVPSVGESSDSSVDLVVDEQLSSISFFCCFLDTRSLIFAENEGNLVFLKKPEHTFGSFANFRIPNSVLAIFPQISGCA